MCIRDSPQRYYHIDGVELNKTVKEKDVGVIIQSSLKFSEQCKKVALTCNRIIGQVRRSFSNKDPTIMMQIFKSYILPHLDYAVSVRNPYMQKDIAILESIQRRYTRMIKGMTGLSYEERLTVLGLPTLQERRDMIDLTQVYRLRNGIDKINRPLFRPVSECHSFATRSSRKGNIAGQKTSLDLRKNFFTNRVITGWNALPQDVQTSSSLNVFKSKMKDELNFL